MDLAALYCLSLLEGLCKVVWVFTIFSIEVFEIFIMEWRMRLTEKRKAQKMNVLGKLIQDAEDNTYLLV